MSKNTQKKQTAVQFLRKMDNMVSIMEGIAQKTRETENALLEEISPDVFDMNNMLDVTTQDEIDQPMLSINKPRDLTDGDKAQIVEEFAEILKRMPGEVIDFSDIGPIGTVIQTKLGFAQTLDGFLKDLITGASDSQNNQAFAKGTPVPGVQDANQAQSAAAPSVEKAPTDIAPSKENIVDAPNAAPAAPVADPMAPVADPMAPTTDLGMTDPTMDMGIDSGLDTQVTDALGDVGMDTPAIDPIAEPTDAPISDLDTPVMDDVAPIADEAPIDDAPITDETPVGEPSNAPTTDDAPVADDVLDADDETAPEGIEPSDIDTDDDTDDLDDTDVKLESIRSNFFAAERQRKVDAIMESMSSEIDRVNERDVKVALESIVAKVKSEKETTAQLEAIAKKAIAKSTPAVAKIKKTVKKPIGLTEGKTAKLNALIENFRKEQDEKKAQMEAIAARKKAREILESVTK